ncbi:MAG: heme-binding domain-containing protein [Archangium sp.]|nr:heme-binding domain-containing protein [Archangium sp.]
MKLVQKVMIGVGVVVVGIQLIRPSQENPPVTGDIGAPAEVATLLKRSCYDCHSNETKWPWYSQVAPVSWLVSKDVNDGRKHLNFSEWQGYEEGRKLKKFKEVAEEVDEGEMPMAIYLPLHPEAKLTDAEKKLLVDWAKRNGAPAP